MKKQHRRTKPLFIIALLVVAGGAAFLWLKDLPAPQNAVEQPLDAQKFLKR